MCDEAYDSAADTLAHSQLVGRYMGAVISELLERSYEHDASKLAEPEKSAFDRCTERLRTLTYGSEEYKASLAELGPALEHHYAHNRHHPERFDNGVRGMTLMDLCEMLADWYAAGQRHDDGNLGRSLVVQQQRFAIGEQLMDILGNTARHLGWLQQS
jgi:hypothetical protein